MNWARLRAFPWIDTRSRFVASVPRGGTLLDIGSSDGETLGHMAELRPDLSLSAVDLEGKPERYPAGCRFQRADLERDTLPWPAGTFDAVTCLHLVEHLQDCGHLLREAARLLKPGGRLYLETPRPKTVMLDSPRGAAAGTFTLNFYDDRTHIRPVAIGALAQEARAVGLRVTASGISRNWLFALSYPLLCFGPDDRKKFTARVHWLGWSAYLIGQRSS
jgi:SAM-dependent methyltransferase